MRIPLERAKHKSPRIPPTSFVDCVYRRRSSARMEEIPHGRMRRNWKIDAQTQVYVDPLVVVVVFAVRG